MHEEEGTVKKWSDASPHAVTFSTVGGAIQIVECNELIHGGAVRDLIQASHKDYLGNTAVKKFINAAVKGDLSNIEKVYSRANRSLLLVATAIEGEGSSDNKVVGCAGVTYFDSMESEVAELKRMAVSESMQRRGIAKQLVTCLEHFCLTEGYGKVRLSTLGPMVGAVALYRACGYTMVEERMMGKGAGVFQLQTFEKVFPM